MIKDFRAVIDLWEPRSRFADDLDEQHGTVRQWYSRNSIPANRWESVVAVARQRGHKQVTLALLAELAASTTRRSHKARAA